MGVSIMMRPGTVMRSLGDPVSISPGWNSKAADLLRGLGGKSPMELNTSYTITLDLLVIGASVYTRDEDNMWLKILTAIREHGCVVISLEG